jgi:hypothetical protein
VITIEKHVAVVKDYGSDISANTSSEKILCRASFNCHLEECGAHLPRTLMLDDETNDELMIFCLELWRASREKINESWFGVVSNISFS